MAFVLVNPQGKPYSSKQLGVVSFGGPMKIIERGIKPDDAVCKSRCMHCKTLVEFQRSEARYVSDQRDGDALVVACPVCEREIWAAVIGG